MIIINVKPKSRNRSAVMAYWMPITLWSWEKTYLCQKGISCSWSAWACACPTVVTLSNFVTPFSVVRHPGS